ncbi:TetR/AcrR family transcriptional regulator [Streptomyces hirsutus]|uniref:TetR/AcrR family transcriptional regulator n=1 Tax=Streptomyces hirsutus TaxID=35620 RepID=UPI0033C7DBC0
MSETSREWPRPKIRPRKAELKNDQIFETAARLFYEKGYAATSLQDLANAVGLRKGSLYYYIDSKKDLLFAITDYAHTFFVELTENAKAEGGTPLQTLERMLLQHARFAAEHFHVTAAFYNERSALSDEYRERIVATRDAYEASLRGLVRSGQESGEIAADLDPRLAVFGVLGMINWIHQWYRPGGSLSPAEIAAALSRQAVRSLLPRAHAD